MVEHKPWRKPFVLISIAILGVGCLLVGFTLGHHNVISDRISNTELKREIRDSRLRLAQLEDDLIDARLTIDVQRKASNAMREDMTGMHKIAARLREEVTFYQGLMSPSSLSKGLRVAELELTESGDTRVFNYKLLLTQAALRRGYIAGEVRLDVIGGYAGSGNEDAVLSLTELIESKAYPLKFRFRYFQDLAGQFTLPQGFVPARVLVTAQENGKEALQVTFSWPDAEHHNNNRPQL